MFTRILDKLVAVPAAGVIGVATLTAAGITALMVTIDEPASSSVPLAVERESEAAGVEGRGAEIPDFEPPPETVPGGELDPLTAHAHHQTDLSGAEDAEAETPPVPTREPSRPDQGHSHGTSTATTEPSNSPGATSTTSTVAASHEEDQNHDHGSPSPGIGGTPGSPSRPARLVVDRDTIVNTQLTLRAGDTIEFRNGARLMFGPGGSADWQGTPTSTWSNDGRNQNLERNVQIFGAGDIMFMKGSRPSTIKYVEIDLRPKQELGHYPLHWHLAGNSVRGTVVEGVVVKNSTNRAYVPHGSHGIAIRDSIAKNIVGEAFWWDQPGSNPEGDNSHDIVWERNLIDTVKDTPLDHNVRLAAMVLGSGDNNVATNNVVLNMSSARGKDCSGYLWPEARGGVWLFENNRAIGGNCNGIFVWQNNGEDHVIARFTAVDVGQACVRHGAYGNNYRYIDLNCDQVEVLAGERDDSPGPRFQGGRIGKVIFAEHRLSGAVRFLGTRVGTVEINNGVNGCGRFLPGDYVFENTGLSFDQIQTTQVCPGTRVFINGSVKQFG